MAWNQDYGEGARPGTEYEQQSWRDYYNNGMAAGDWTGNHNARIAAERAAFGTTWSGSSSQPSALQLAQAGFGGWAGTGTGHVFVSNGVAQFQAAGPGNPVVANGPAAQQGQAGMGPGNPAAATGGGVKPKPNEGPQYVPVFVPGFGPKTKVHDGEYRHMGIGFGLTWASPADYAPGQEIEDEMGEWGALPFQIHKMLNESVINAGRAADWGMRELERQVSPTLNSIGETAGGWMNTSAPQGFDYDYDRDRVNPFSYAGP